MLAPITTLGLYGGPVSAPGPGLAPVAGPLVTLSFYLPLAGPIPACFPRRLQGCQNSVPNVVLSAQVLDQDGNTVDISAATRLQYWLLAPDGTVRAATPRFATTGLDGQLTYTTTAQDLNQAGEWALQAQITFGTQVLTTRWARFRAGLNVPDELAESLA